jgi:RES domain-containing protein
MVAWRVTRKAHTGKPLSGEGARRFGGRWNHLGVPVVYTSESLSLVVVLEYLVNVPIRDLPRDLFSIRVHIPDNLDRAEIRIDDLPRGWRTFPAPEALKDIGQNWVENRTAAILIVPSVVIPGEHNVLINPAHALARKIRVARIEPFALDERLYGSRKRTKGRVRSSATETAG